VVKTSTIRAQSKRGHGPWAACDCPCMEESFTSRGWVGWQQKGLRVKTWQRQTRQGCRETKKLWRGAGSRYPTATALCG